MDPRNCVLRLAANLGVVAQCGKGQKLHVAANGELSVDVSMIPFVVRRLNGDSREATLSALRKIVDDLTQWAGLLVCLNRMQPQHKEYMEMAAVLECASVNVPCGLRNIKDTYSDDQIVASTIEELIAKVDARPRL